MRRVKHLAYMRFIFVFTLVFLAFGCSEGRGGPVEFGSGSEEEARYYDRLQKRADDGNLDQGALLVTLKYWRQAETLADTLEAIEMYERYAEEGSARAASALFRIYVQGEGVQPDTLEAAKWLEVGATNGSVEMQRSLDAWNNR